MLLAMGAVLGLLLWRQLTAIAGLYRQSEVAARQRAEILQTTLASIGDAVIATDDKGMITFLNGMAERLTDWASEEARGKPLREVFNIFNEDTGQPASDPVGQVLQKGVTGGLANHTVLRSRDGRELPIADSGAPIRDPSGRIWGVVLVFRDCTKDRQVHRLQSYLAAIVQNSDDAIISKNLDGIVTAWNRGAEHVFGYKPEEAIGQSITFFIPPDRQHEEPGILEKIKHGQKVDHYQTVRLRKDGSPVDVAITISPIRDEQGKVIGASKIVRDISREKADELALRKAKEELEQRVSERTRELTQANERLKEVDRLKSEFLATMSHELRTPLNSIIGFTEIIKGGRTGRVNEKQAQYLEMAYASAKHLLNLINDLLDLSRIEAGREEVFIESFELLSVAREAVQTVEPIAQRKNLTLEMNVNAPGPIYSDRKKLYQILLNLLSNAVKFTEHGRVRLEAQAVDNQLTVTVADTGVGMTPEQLTSLFEAFRRGEASARRVYEGTGLGLYLCKKLVMLLGGEIHAQSESGKGSRLSFTIPIKPPTRAHGQTQNPVS